MDKADGPAGSLGRRQLAPEQGLLHEAFPAVEKGKADAKAVRPLGQGLGIEGRLVLGDHDDSGLAHPHIDALLPEDRNRCLATTLRAG